MGDMANPALINALSRGYDPAARESQLLGLQAQRNALADYPGEKAWTEEERGMKRTESDLMNKARTFDLWNKMLDVSTLENHDQIRASLKNPDFIPPASEFGGDKKKFETWKAGVKGWMKNEFRDVEWKQDAQGNYVPLYKQMRPGEAPPEVKGREAAQSDYGKIAQDMFGMSYSKLDPEQKKQVDEAIKGKKTGEITEYQRESLDLRKEQGEENRALRKQMHEENIAIRKDMMELTKNKMNRIPPSAIKDINNKTGTLDKYVQLIDSFKDNYAGSVVLGPTMTEIYSRTGSKKERVNWWKEWLLLDNQVRHDLFGATLTGYEKASWDKVTISENTDPAIARKAMQTRLRIAKEALDREVEGYSEAGYGAQKPKEQPGGKGGTVQFREGDKTWNVPGDQADEFTRSHPKAKKEQRVSQLKAPPEKREGPDYSTLSDDDLENMLQGAPSNAWLQKEAEKRWGKEWKKKIFGQGENLETAIG